MDKAQTGSPSVKVAPAPVAPAETRDEGGEAKGHEEDEPQIPAVLPPDNLVLGEIRNISNTGLATRLEDHPA